MALEIGPFPAGASASFNYLLFLFDNDYSQQNITSKPLCSVRRRGARRIDLSNETAIRCEALDWRQAAKRHVNRQLIRSFAYFRLRGDSCASAAACGRAA